jgi:dipeptidyl aminopeptidase/acylaminoacyl peptidase
VTGPNDGAEYVLVDLNTMMTTPIGRMYAGVAPSDISAVTRYAYKASDGLDLSGYLTLPRGRDAKGLPLIVLPHGGPEARDMPAFDWWAQALASRGYAVLQPQFRGSGGYGWTLFAKGFGQWGRKMQTDLSDGVRALAKDGTIDPKRVCIVGGSYGGYAALGGPTLDPGVYRCAVSLAGISDLASFRAWLVHRQSGRDDSPDIQYLDRFFGTKGGDDPGLAAISPAKNVGRVNVPLLLIHGKDDTVVPLEQSQIMADAMKAAGKDVSFIVMDGEDHWLSRAQTRTQALEAMVAFLEKNNPP